MTTDNCTSCGKPLEVFESTHKDAISVEIPGVGVVHYTVYLVACKHCGDVVDNQTYLTT